MLSYQTTQHAPTGVAPAKLLSGRDNRDKLPGKVSPTNKSDYANTSKAVKKCDDKHKAIIEQYADTKNRASFHNIKPDNPVLIANKFANKNMFVPYWNPNPYKINAVKRNSIIIQKGPKSVI